MSASSIVSSASSSSALQPQSSALLGILQTYIEPEEKERSLGVGYLAHPIETLEKIRSEILGDPGLEKFWKKPLSTELAICLSQHNAQTLLSFRFFLIYPEADPSWEADKLLVTTFQRLFFSILEWRLKYVISENLDPSGRPSSVEIEPEERLFPDISELGFFGEEIPDSFIKSALSAPYVVPALLSIASKIFNPASSTSSSSSSATSFSNIAAHITIPQRNDDVLNKHFLPQQRWSFQPRDRWVCIERQQRGREDPNRMLHSSIHLFLDRLRPREEPPVSAEFLKKEAHFSHALALKRKRLVSTSKASPVTLPLSFASSSLSASSEVVSSALPSVHSKPSSSSLPSYASSSSSSSSASSSQPICLSSSLPPASQSHPSSWLSRLLCCNNPQVDEPTPAASSSSSHSSQTSSDPGCAPIVRCLAHRLYEPKLWTIIDHFLLYPLAHPCPLPQEQIHRIQDLIEKQQKIYQTLTGSSSENIAPSSASGSSASSSSSSSSSSSMGPSS